MKKPRHGVEGAAFQGYDSNWLVGDGRINGQDLQLQAHAGKKHQITVLGEETVPS